MKRTGIRSHSHREIYWQLREWWATIIGVCLAIALILAASFGHFDLIALNLTILTGIEKNEIDDILVMLALIFSGIATDWWIRERRKRRRSQTENEENKLKVLKATMRTVQDLMNNFLNNIQLFRIEAEGALPEESLELFDDLIEQTSGKLKALGDLDCVNEIQMASGTGIEVPSTGQAASKGQLCA
jgi:hypothetical protein